MIQFVHNEMKTEENINLCNKYFWHLSSINTTTRTTVHDLSIVVVTNDVSIKSYVRIVAQPVSGL